MLILEPEQRQAKVMGTITSAVAYAACDFAIEDTVFGVTMYENTVISLRHEPHYIYNDDLL